MNLASIEQIKMLKARYWRCIDTRQWEDLRDTLSADAMLDFGEQQFPRDEFIPWVKGFLENSVTVHHGSVPEIELIDEDNATGIWPFRDRIWWEGPNPLGLSSIEGDGWYHERYRRIDGVWKISDLRVVRQRMTAEPIPA